MKSSLFLRSVRIFFFFKFSTGPVGSSFNRRQIKLTCGGKRNDQTAVFSPLLSWDFSWLGHEWCPVPLIHSERNHGLAFWGYMSVSWCELHYLLPRPPAFSFSLVHVPSTSLYPFHRDTSLAHRLFWGEFVKCD